MEMNETNTHYSNIRQPALVTWLRLARVFQKVQLATSHHLEAYHLSTAQFDVLAQVFANQGCTQQEIAQALLVTKGNISQLLTRMEHDGLLERRSEGRSNALFLTTKGRTLAQLVIPAQEALINRLLQGLSVEQQTTLHSILRTLDRHLDQ
jgi:DNA-binding MarR family transcriptional regulator